MKQAITIAFGLLLVAGSATADTLIHAGRLIDVDAGRTYNDQTIRVNGTSGEITIAQ